MGAPRLGHPCLRSFAGSHPVDPTSYRDAPSHSPREQPTAAADAVDTTVGARDELDAFSVAGDQAVVVECEGLRRERRAVARREVRLQTAAPWTELDRVQARVLAPPD